MNTLTVQNLRCGGCANTITKALQEIEGTSNIAVDIDLSTISFVSSSDEVVENVKKKLSQLGYPEADAKNNIRHKTISIISCATGKMSLK
jgi:copper chaperone CopZ